MPRHVFACCQIGVERLLKAEVSRLHPHLRPGFARPGLVTWVSDREVSPNVALGAIFARVWGASLGRASTIDEARALIPPGARVHVFARDPDHPVAGWDLGPGGDASPGELVADVIVAPDEPALIGAHRHVTGRWAVAGGWPRIELPAEAPSRAFAKIEEAIAWAGLDLRAGEVALEIGSAPGGAALALARRGLTVWGADPGAMDAAVLAYRHPSGARVHHLPRTIGALRWEELPPRVDWLLLDVNLAPQVAVHELARLVPPLREHLRGAVLTLKLNDQLVVDELPSLLGRVRALGLGDVRATHLPSNRREVCCVIRA